LRLGTPSKATLLARSPMAYQGAKITGLEPDIDQRSPATGRVGSALV
jgi:hypothetical protein